MADVREQIRRRYQHLLDKTVPYTSARWIAFALGLVVYGLRVYSVAGFYIVTYGLGIYVLNLFIGFITPPIDPETDGPLLPTRNAASEEGEFRPFAGRVPEFKFWYSGVRAVFVAFVMTLFPFFNIPVFWPILLIYFITLFALTMRNQIAHMIKHRYIPITWGKQKYAGKGKKPEGVQRPLSNEPRFDAANVK